MTLMYHLARHWAPACERRGLVKLVAEVRVPEARRSRAHRLGREVLLACALDADELDEVLSEIALLTLADDGTPSWRFARRTGRQAASETGGQLTAHFARSFFTATWLGAPAALRTARAQVVFD